MTASAKIERETDRAWWCPVDDHANAQSSDVCGGCGAVRDGDKVVPRGKAGSGGSEEVDALKARVTELEDAANGALSYGDLSAEALKVEAEKTNTKVVRGDGKEGDPLKADYVKALTEARAS